MGGSPALSVVSFAAALLIRLLRATMRLEHRGRGPLEEREKQQRSTIIAFWHGRLLLMPYSYRGGRMSILISQHRDGEYIARTMGWFGHRALRGSTTRGGMAALRAAVRRLRQGDDVAFTPDGPRGPRFRVQAGVIQAARLSGAPVIPVAFSARPARTLGSWDRFVVPLPFSRGVFLYGEPLQVPRDATSEEMESLRLHLESTLRRMTADLDGVPLADAEERAAAAGDGR